MSRGRWIWSLAVFARLVASCTAAPTPVPVATELLAPGKVPSFGKWTVGCNNLRSCTAIAPVAVNDGVEATPYVQISIAGTFSDADNISIMRAGEKILSLSPAAAVQLKQDLQRADGPRFVRLGNAETPFDVPREGFAEVLAALEEWRTKTPSAAISTDVVTPLPAVRLENPIPPLKFAGTAKSCPVAVMGQSLQAWRLIDGQTLWQAGCGDEGLNAASFWFIAGPQGMPAVEVTFEDRAGPVTLANSNFDPASGYLRSEYYFGHWESHTDDCGIYRAYAFGFQQVKLVEQRLMPQCGTGIGPEGWITTYRATVLNGPDSGP